MMLLLVLLNQSLVTINVPLVKDLLLIV
jgi:hypothetical protein